MPGKPRGRPFVKGQSGNPRGRPPEYADVRAAAREHTTEAIERLAFWMRTDDPRASPAACSALLARGWGQPGQTLAVDLDATVAVQVMTPEQRALEVAKLMADLAKLGPKP